MSIWLVQLFVLATGIALVLYGLPLLLGLFVGLAERFGAFPRASSLLSALLDPLGVLPSDLAGDTPESAEEVVQVEEAPGVHTGIILGRE